MRWAIAAAMLAGLAAAQTDRQVISVAASGKAVVRPDTAVVFLSVRSRAPLAADALEQNTKKTRDIQAKLAAMGYPDAQVKFTGNRFAPAGGAMYYPGRDRPTGFDVYNNIYIFLTDLKDLNAFNGRAGTLLDELSKLGAAPLNMPVSSYSMGGTSVVAFTLKDASAAEKQAIADAIDRARPVAEDIVRRMSVKITGIESVVSMGGMRGMVSGPVNPLEEVPFEYFSSSIDELPVRLRVDVRYTYK
jgi:uncharacterized protein YggE